MFAFEILLTGVVFTDFIPLVVSLKLSKLQKAIAGGILLSMLCLLFPPLFGEGYASIKDMINGRIQIIIEHSFFRYLDLGSWIVIVFLTMVCIFKAFAASITIHSGGNGGNFAPSLFAGGTMGYLFATICVQLGFEQVPVTNLIIVGMAGMMSGVLYAPLTAIFLIAESSTGYDLLIPLMIVCVISFLITKWFSAISPDLKHLADTGKIFTREYDKNLLLLINISNLVEKDVSTVSFKSSLKDLIEVIKAGKRNLIAVLDENRHLVGTVSIDDIRPILFDEQKRSEVGVAEIMKYPPAIISEKEDMVAIANKFDQTGSWVLPVIASNDQFVGFVSKSAFLNTYREILKEHSEI